MAVFVLAPYEYWVAQNDTVRLARPLIFRALGYQTSNRTENYLFFDAVHFKPNPTSPTHYNSKEPFHSRNYHGGIFTQS